MKVVHGVLLHQQEYLDSKLKQRDIKYGRPALPEVEEGREPPVTADMKNTKSYHENLNQVQEEVGSLQWLARIPHPDIAAITDIGASLQSQIVELAINYGNASLTYIYEASDIATKLIHKPDVLKVNSSAGTKLCPRWRPV